MSMADIREQIRTILSGVAGIGVVHDYYRWSTDWNKFLSLFQDADRRINGWMISRQKTPERVSAQGGRNSRTHHFKIIGIYGLKDEDATELVFQDLVEAICTKFRSEDTLNGTVWSCTPAEDAPDGAAGIQVDLIENRVFGSVLCHYAELSLYAQELISY